MWIRTFLTNLYLRWGGSDAIPPIKRTSTERMRCQELLRRLEPKRLRHYVSQDGMARQLQLPYPRVDVFTLALREIVGQLQEDKALSPQAVRTELTSVSLDRFLTSSDGFYLDPPEAVGKWRAIALELCAQLESSDYASHGVAEHNLRMLRQLLQSLTTIAAALLEVSRDA